VPLILVDGANKSYALKDTRGILANISPTLLDMIGIPLPAEMTAESLLEK
jgi:2,3-bisphosphoglycerate-independent phosphoglycerate mutase